ncbi:hypothetical protein E1B28_011035 [Marasmius oreades]|uniref:Uncharacterized protein n=1 Tax=Marasmius oreades TaxID=181124 RepID=A0A9P7UPT1_9AGAR|nr:uncharacterized protein E1B28_011035 [Marasmius oreades]KAG7089345.1 hypothetical protein E1B28_011035 [Marasmius oreades]
MLRAKLSLASYKAAHNIGHIPLAELEAQIPPHLQPPILLPTSTTPFRSTTVKRKPSAAPGNSLLPPPSFSHASRNSSSLINGFGSSPLDAPHASQSHSLFTSILAPPPTSQARTIFNAHDPPIPAPVRPPPSTVTKSIAEGTRAQAKGRDVRRRPSGRTAEATATTSSPKRKGKRPARTELKPGSSKRSRKNASNDDRLDMEAAATLTTLLLHNQRGVGVSSPRSSVDGSAMSDGTGSQSQNSFPSFSQSTTKGAGARTPPGSRTPLPSDRTPRPATTEKDNEAADLMLYLATSPSPVRPSNQNKDARDMAAFRALGGGGAAKKAPPGRVLFGGELPGPRQIGRGEGSFHSSISSIGSEMGAHPAAQPLSQRTTSRLSVPGGSSPPQSQGSSGRPSSRLGSGGGSPLLAPPPNVGSSPRSGSADNFNFNEYINASPAASPVRKVGVMGTGGTGGSLRADVGRKLFEEEMGRSARGSVGAPAQGSFTPVGSFGGPPIPAQPRRGSGERLGAGIELGMGGR